MAGARVARIGAGISMILAPLFLLASSLLGPPHSASKTLSDQLPYVGAEPARFLAFVLLGLLSLALLIPATLGIAHLLFRQKPLLALTGATLLVVGILCSAVIQGVGIVQHQMVAGGSDQAQMAALLQRVEGGVGAKVVFVGLVLGLSLGWVILSVGLFVTRVAPRAIPVVILASLMLNVAGLELYSRFLFLLGLAWLGIIMAGGPSRARATAGADLTAPAT